MLHLVTVATHSERYLPVLDKQAEDNDMKLVKLGMGKKYIGHFMKDLEMIEYLKTVPKEDIVIFLVQLLLLIKLQTQSIYLSGMIDYGE